jgi:hypothetical protein
MRTRFEAFALALHPGRTGLIEFGRQAAVNRDKRGLGKQETFNFLWRKVPGLQEDPARPQSRCTLNCGSTVTLPKASRGCQLQISGEPPNTALEPSQSSSLGDGYAPLRSLPRRNFLFCEHANH